MEDYFKKYIEQQHKLLESIPTEKITEIVKLFKTALDEGRNIFVFGNGGSAANASHFVTDLGKGSSDALSKRFRCLSLNDNTNWITALGNDYAYDQVFVRQLMNFAREGDLVLTMSVSGDSPNLVKAVAWAKENKVITIALVGGKKGKLSEIADTVVVVDDTHYGRVEDAHMTICHMIAYAFMESESLKN